MKEYKIPRVVVADTHSGVGKTTIVTGLIAALTKMGLKVQSYKVGPDYIDPGFHRLAGGQSSHNLDTWLLPSDKLLPMFVKTAGNSDIAVIEGVMGLFDGGKNGVSSTAAIAKLLAAPVVLVIDAKAMGESAAAIALGYKMYDPEVNFAGVIINRLGSSAHEEIVTTALSRLQIPVFGCLRRDELLHLPERHLGLTPVAEIQADDVIKTMGEKIRSQVDIEGLVALANMTDLLSFNPAKKVQTSAKVRIGVADDAVFSFYYAESLEQLVEHGVELVKFSPLYDKKLPTVDGIILGGGFPEMFLKELSSNSSMHTAIREAIADKMPVYAECGGLMYLCQQIVDLTGEGYQMAGIIPAICKMQPKLETVGYVMAEALKDNLLCCKGETLKGHEFHFSRMQIAVDNETFPWAFQFKKVRTGNVYMGGFAKDNVLASYLHMHFAGNLAAVVSFIDKCKIYNRKGNRAF